MEKANNNEQISREAAHKDENSIEYFRPVGVKGRDDATRALLDIRNLQAFYATDAGPAKAVNGLDLTLYQRETLGLLGERGCGKSVIALSIMRLVPDPPGRIVEGEILLYDRDLLKLSEAQMNRVRGNIISMIFQDSMNALNPVLRIGYQLTEVIQRHQKIDHKEAKAWALDMLSKVGIPDPARRLKEYPQQISPGMRQRVLIALALSNHPRLVIAEEPTTTMDATTLAQILGLMNELKEEMGISHLLITQDPGVIAEMADWVAVMYAGFIVEYASVKGLFGQSLHPYTIGLMASIPKIDQPPPQSKMLMAIPGEVPGRFDLMEGCPFRIRCKHALEWCRMEMPPLANMGGGHLVRCWLHEP
jgi:peptide/nickel transport system ATP-binding protein/oligopeptide transport system ATP-binding protein